MKESTKQSANSYRLVDSNGFTIAKSDRLDGMVEHLVEGHYTLRLVNTTVITTITIVDDVFTWDHKTHEELVEVHAGGAYFGDTFEGTVLMEDFGGGPVPVGYIGLNSAPDRYFGALWGNPWSCTGVDNDIEYVKLVLLRKVIKQNGNVK